MATSFSTGTTTETMGPIVHWAVSIPLACSRSKGHRVLGRVDHADEEIVVPAANNVRIGQRRLDVGQAARRQLDVDMQK